MRHVSASVHAVDNFDSDIIRGLGVDYVHVDVFDGLFCENKQDNLNCFKILKKATKVPIIAHMMVVDPINYVDRIIEDIDIFEFHFESKGDKELIINSVKSYNKMIGIVLNPDTPISVIEPFLDNMDIVLIMSVFPGYSGQKFIPETIRKVKELVEYKKKYDFLIEVDGGINLENSRKLHGVDILCSASTIFNSKDPNDTIELLKQSDEK
ncbi:MAG: ribulose-phosphate 3-epimerase [Candidatus Lokiarchaeota archaeon]|nr:ribulose-phosphate 3-epimerase [Candidatus Lokiarchaeota archaeon]